MDFGGNVGGEREIVGKCFACETQTEKYGHCAFAMCHQHLLLCDKHLDKQVFCTEKCLHDNQIMKKRVSDYMNNNLVSEQ